jgi:hypothetical protein
VNLRCDNMLRGLLIGGLCGYGCASTDDDTPVDATIAPDAAGTLTSGEVCDALTDLSCARDRECFEEGLGEPCPENFRDVCCGNSGTCGEETDTTQDDINTCLSDLAAISCAALEEALPDSCLGIATPRPAGDAGAASSIGSPERASSIGSSIWQRYIAACRARRDGGTCQGCGRPSCKTALLSPNPR